MLSGGVGWQCLLRVVQVNQCLAGARVCLTLCRTVFVGKGLQLPEEEGWAALHVKGSASQPVFGWCESVSHSMQNGVHQAGIAAPGGGRLGGVHLG